MEKTNDHIEEYFLKNDNNASAIASKELFKDEKIELRTDLCDEEIVLINNLKFNDMLLENAGLKPVFKIFTNNFMKLKVSKDRKSRGEFVSINRTNNTEEVMQGMGQISNILGVKK